MNTLFRLPADQDGGAPAAGALRIERGRVLVDGAFINAAVDIGENRNIAGLDLAASAVHRIDADGLLVLPGIVDIHGDAFERQMMPRPGVGFPVDIALLDSDRQVLANGITTVFHSVTCSWEPGLRGPENARAIITALDHLRPQLGADTRFHLRHETFNLDAEAEVLGWLTSAKIDALAFNDHMTSVIAAKDRAANIRRMSERSGVSHTEFEELMTRVQRGAPDVPGSIERLAAAARAAGVPLLSHDDMSPDQRRWYRALGCRATEFPTTMETAQDAASAGDDIIFGAPNVVRGGSHLGWTNAAEMVARGLCSILASDYYYPAPLLAAFRLAAAGVTPLECAWSLVSSGPARSMGLADRGTIAAGKRADLILVDASDPARPRVAAAIVAGRPVYLAAATRIC
ncbi:MAG: alpha-D-ribose 1-methylphosphonate 5-triphosphate diphosphatase [Hyphomicrobiales bacterium]